MTVPNGTPKAPRSLFVVFWTLVAAFSALVLTVLLPDLFSFFRALFLSFLALCLLFGLALLVLSIRWRARTLLRTFWILTGAATAGAALGSVLHNAFYALGTVTDEWPVLHGAMEVLGGTFFVIATILCPVAFLVGTVGAIVLLVRRSRPAATAT